MSLSSSWKNYILKKLQIQVDDFYFLHNNVFIDQILAYLLNMDVLDKLNKNQLNH